MQSDSRQSGMRRSTRDLRTDGTIREKYNVVSGNANVQVSAGYKTNVIGFGWTNAVYLKMKRSGRRSSDAKAAD